MVCWVEARDIVRKYVVWERRFDSGDVDPIRGEEGGGGAREATQGSREVDSASTTVTTKRDRGVRIDINHFKIQKGSHALSDQYDSIRSHAILAVTKKSDELFIVQIERSIPLKR